MTKEIKYEARDVNEVFIDIADEIKNGWKLYCFSMPYVECSLACKHEVTMEVKFCKEF